MLTDRTFTDEQVTGACAIHVDNLRKLITWGALTPAQAGGGRGRVRLWTMDHVARISGTAAIFNQARVSLRLAHTVAYCLPFDGLFRFLHVTTLGLDLDWLEPGDTKPAPQPDDWLVDVINRRFVLLRLSEGASDAECFGLLDEDAGEFLSACDLSREHKAWRTIDPSGLVEHYRRARWEQPRNWYSAADPNSLAYRYVGDIDQDDVRAVAAAPLSKLTINLSLAFRIAARRVLDLPVDYPTVQRSDAAPAGAGAASVVGHRGGNPGAAPSDSPNVAQTAPSGNPEHGPPRRHGPDEDDENDRARSSPGRCAPRSRRAV